MRADPPRKTQRRPLVSGGLAFRDDFWKVVRGPRFRRLGHSVCLLLQHSTTKTTRLLGVRHRLERLERLRKIRGDDAHVLLGGQHGQRVAFDRRCDDRLDERRCQRPRGRDIHVLVQPDDPAERRERIRFPRAHIRRIDRRRGGDTAWIRMFDHNRGRFGKFQRNPQRRVEIEQVRVGQLLPLMHVPCAAGIWRELNPGRALMRILSISKRTWPAVRRSGRARRYAARHGAACHVDVRHRHRNHAVVLTGMHERTLHQIEPEVERRAVRARQFLKHFRIVLRVDHHEHVAKVLRRRAKQTGTTDIDLLDETIERCIGIFGCLAEWIQVDDDEVDRLDPLRADSLEVVGAAAAGEDPTKYRGMEGLDATIHHFWKTRDVRNIYNWKPGCSDCFRRPTG